MPPTARHAALYERFYTDADASAPYGGPITRAQAWSRLAQDIGHWQLRGFGVWIIETKDARAAVGTCGFWQGLDWPRELTWWLTPDARGTGYATEASRAAISHAYAGFGWSEVQTYMDDSNEAARKLVLRLGGEMVERIAFPDGKMRDLFSIPKPGKN
ncbi:GNAT family N-acetyltransferase [Parasphingopyxis lamellibrachiae]|uniref:RimJ/RimL family protein N-acetyltransferase n=1 Tax=Parasphingopyxis lamellibrachiae TaxID=680125 RepID=A0A3D9FEZ4_9SPHN|nr:GNAT family N-acetyltransferase [Parasphingopyxis lamellibrachiae]RED16228.1 RimJ/RimL family protein N-acetyltransferase [Parasphingopyxis lamellibrachiae]